MLWFKYFWKQETEMTKFIEKLFDVECFITQTHSRDVFSVLGTLPKSMKAFFALL